MKIKLDENMPAAAAALLRSARHNVVTVAQENLSGADDHVVMEAASGERRLLITFDTDFGDIRRYPLGTHSGIVVFRLPDQRWRAMREPLQLLVESGLLGRLRRGLAVVTESRVRIRTAPKRGAP